MDLMSRPTPRPAWAPSIYKGDGDPIAGAPPIDWSDMLGRFPVCRIVQNYDQPPADAVERILILPATADDIPDHIRSELSAILHQGGAIAIHTRSTAAADLAVREIRRSQPRFMA